MTNTIQSTIKDAKKGSMIHTSSKCLALVSLMAILPMAAVSAQASVITVTTTQDQDGEDSSNCSLREAVHAALAKKAYGGCSAGKKYFEDTIKLPAGTFTLTKEIQVLKRIDKFGRGIRIEGAKPVNWQQRNAITGKMGNTTAHKSIIESVNYSRAFNTAFDDISLSLNNLKITNTGGEDVEYGGAILAGGPLKLFNVAIDKSTAQKSGGAVYLTGDASSLKAKRLLVANSRAINNQGAAVLAHSCNNNLQISETSIHVEDSSIVNNNAISSIIKTCGAPDIKISNTTIANNQGGYALSLTDNQIKSIGGSLRKATVKLDHVNIQNNNKGIAYNNSSNISIDNSVVAFNNNADCSYTDSTTALANQNSITMRYSLLTGSDQRPATNKCQIKPLQADGSVVADTKNTYVNESGQSQLFIGGLQDYGFGLLGYLPKVTQDSPLASKNCRGTDARGVQRQAAENNDAVACYKGAITTSSLQAQNDFKVVNTSYQDYVQRLEQAIDKKPNDSYTAEELQAFNADTQAYKKELQAFKNVFIKDNNPLVRVAVVDIFENDIPHEKATQNSSVIEHFPLLRDSILDAQNYTITAQAMGTGFENFLTSQQVDAQSQNNLVCAWDAQLNKLIAYRKNATVTPAGKFDWCKYTITHNESGTAKSAYVQIKFNNIAPIAKNITIDSTGDEERIDIDIKSLISDNGDGPNRDGDTAMFTSSSQKKLYIEIIKQPEIGKLIFGTNDVVTCPKANQSQLEETKCHGGSVTYVRNNTVSDFGDSFMYKVYDCGVKNTDGSCDSKTSLASNDARVLIKTNYSNKKTSVLKGGGSFGIWFIGFMAVLASFVAVLHTKEKA